MLNRAIQLSENLTVLGLLVAGSAMMHLAASREARRQQD